MTSSNLNHLQKAPSPNTTALRVWGFQWECGGDVITQRITGPPGRSFRRLPKIMHLSTLSLPVIWRLHVTKRHDLIPESGVRTT